MFLFRTNFNYFLQIRVYFANTNRYVYKFNSITLHNMTVELPRIESASFRYSSKIMPSPYLGRLGFIANDAGVNPFAESGVLPSQYSLHDSFTIKNKDLSALWAAALAVSAPEQGIFKYGPREYLHLPLKDVPRDATLQSFSLQFEQMPEILALRGLEASLNEDGLLGKVVAVRTGDDSVAIVSPSLIDTLDRTDFPADARKQVLEAYGLRMNNIRVLRN